MTIPTAAGDASVVLPDVLQPGLRLVICGSAVGTMSASVGAYYAHPQNRFWRTLHEVGLTPQLLPPAEYARLADYGIGLTDLCKAHSGCDAALPSGGYDPATLRSKLVRYRPRVLAFNGKAPAQAFLRAGRVDYGLQAERCEGIKLYVLPSTSPAARRYWNACYWRQLAHDIDAPASSHERAGWLENRDERR